VTEPKRKMPAPATIEIVEKRPRPADDSPLAQVVVPNEVRLNGVPLMVTSDHPVTVHEISTTDRNAVLVTLTLVARRVFIGDDFAGDSTLGDVTAAAKELADAQRESAERILQAHERVRDAQQRLASAQREAVVNRG
jgi:hypothetical protein